MVSLRVREDARRSKIQKSFFGLVVLLSVQTALSCGIAQATEYRQADVDAELKNLESEDYGTRKTAAYHLTEMGKDAKSAIPALIEVLKTDPAAPVRGEISKALGLMGESAEPAVPAIIAFLQSDDGGYERTYAASALGDIGKRADIAVPALQKALESDGEPVVRELAARALAGFKSEAQPALPALLEAIKSGDKNLREAACAGLKDIPANAAAVTGLTELLSDEIEHIRAAAASSLGGAGSEAAPAVPALVKLLDDKNTDVKRAALKALGQIGPTAKEALPTLKIALKDPFLKSEAQYAIDQIKNKH